MAFTHQPVLAKQTLGFLAPHPRGHYVDATVGGGGHAEAVLEASAPDGRLLGVDRDPAAVEAASRRLARFGTRALVVRGRYGELGALLDTHGFGTERNGARRVDGLLIDAGVSSHQLDEPGRGFSFQKLGPLDMRMSQSGSSCADLIDRSSSDELAGILRRFGEVKGAGRIARAIKAARAEGKLETTRDLAQLVRALVRPRPSQTIHPATQVFQALRIAVNDELGDLERVCQAIPDLLDEGGVAVVISFHSLEDRIVKRALRRHADGPPVPSSVPLRESERPQGTLNLLTSRPVMADDDERAANPRARSARLRAARRRPIEEAA